MNKNTLLLLLKIFAIGVLIFIGLLYYVLRTKVNNVSSEEPFKSVINQKVTTKSEAIVFRNTDAFVQENDYELVNNTKEIYAEITEKYTIPIGTPLKIEKAKIFTNGTSGFSHSYVLGTIYIKELKKDVFFEYRWGEKHISLYGNEKEYWSFDKAIWETQKLEGKFYFE